MSQSTPANATPTTLQQIIADFSETIFWNNFEKWPARKYGNEPELELVASPPAPDPDDDRFATVHLTFVSGEATVSVATMRVLTNKGDAESGATDADVKFIQWLPVYMPVLLDLASRAARAEADAAELASERDGAQIEASHFRAQYDALAAEVDSLTKQRDGLPREICDRITKVRFSGTNKNPEYLGGFSMACMICADVALTHLVRFPPAAGESAASATPEAPHFVTGLTVAAPAPQGPPSPAGQTLEKLLRDAARHIELCLGDGGCRAFDFAGKLEAAAVTLAGAGQTNLVRQWSDAFATVGDRLTVCIRNGGNMEEFLAAGSMRELLEADTATRRAAVLPPAPDAVPQTKQGEK